MRIDEIISGIEGEGPRSYYQFETFVHQLLKKHLSDQNKSYEICNERLGFWDAIAENGFDDIHGYTLIEIKFHLSRFSPTSFIDRVIKYISSNDFNVKINNILIISAKPISEKWLKYFHDYKDRFPPDLNFIFWGPSQLNSIQFNNK